MEVEKQTLKEYIEERATGKEKESVFLVSPATDEELTFAKLEKEVSSFSEELVKRGAKKGDRVALLLENGIEFAIGFFGTVYAGQVCVPLNLSYKEKELKYLISDSNARFLLTTKKVFEEKSELLQKAFAFEKDVITDREFVLLRIKEEDNTGDIPDDLALILYTSGTTGNPKGVMLTNGNLIAEAQNVVVAHDLTKEDVALGILPLFHINGLVITLITPLYVGMKLILPPKFSASNFWKWVDRYKVTWFSGVPTIYSILLSKEVDASLSFQSLRFARSASSALPVAVLEEFEKRYKVPIIESFGISEGASQITSNPLPPKVTKPGSVGIPFGNEVRIVDSENRIMDVNVEGEIVIRGGNIALGYWKKEKETKEAFQNGWFHTGDLGYLDEDGYLFISGRKKELINRAGEKFSPREIDEVLYQLPQVELAAAVGVPSAMYNEEVVAYIKLREKQVLTEEEIINFCRTKLADFKVPKEIFFTADFPKGPSGKIQRLKFIDRYVKKEK